MHASSSSDRADLHKTESCIRCGESVSEDATRCSNCGYDAADHEKRALIHLVLGTVSFPTIIGPVVFGWKAGGHWKKHKRGITG
ncbi:MAG: ribosomal protein L37E [Natronomonas sp.]|jgi:ribosomal protein L37E